MDLSKATYTLPRTVISEGQALTLHIIAPDNQTATNLSDENKKDSELAKVELIAKEVIAAVRVQ